MPFHGWENSRYFYRNFRKRHSTGQNRERNRLFAVATGFLAAVAQICVADLRQFYAAMIYKCDLCMVQ